MLRGDLVTTTSYLFIATLQLLCHVSNAQCNFILAVLNLILCLCLSGRFGQQATSCGILPNDAHTVMTQLNMNPSYHAFMCCPKCFKFYDGSHDDEGHLPFFCSGKAHPGVHFCQQPLQRTKMVNGTRTKIPCKQYLQQDFREWLGRFLCRPGMEEMLDADPFSAETTSDSNRRTRDIWDGAALRELKGPDGRPFVTGKRKRSEGRYVFGLCMDGFNPLRSKEAGKKYSLGAIYMICFNLPPALRYRMENVFLVGIIPGLHEPSKEQINNFLAPLVDELLYFYEHGVRYSATPLHSQGHKIRVMLGPLICDLPAARQMAGFASHSHTQFCSVCKLTKNRIKELNDAKFIPRTNKEHRRFAQAWKDAPTQSQRKKIFDEGGVRWSELLRLPYWKPINSTPIDTMHCLFLGVFRRHCRVIWGMDAHFEDGDGDTSNLSGAVDELSETELSSAWRVLRHGSNPALRKLRHRVMVRLCEDLDITTSKKDAKKILGNHLLNYVSVGFFCGCFSQFTSANTARLV